MAEKYIRVESDYKGDKIITGMPIPPYTMHEEVIAEFVHRVQVTLVYTLEDVSRFFCEDDSTNLDSLLYRLCELIDEQE